MLALPGTEIINFLFVAYSQRRPAVDDSQFATSYW